MTKLSRTVFTWVWACVIITAGAAPAAVADGTLRPVPFTQVKLTDDFWAPRIRTCIEKTIPHNFKLCEETGRIRNWEKAAAALAKGDATGVGEYEGYFFNDSDVYKAMEAAAYALAHDPKARYGDKLLSEYLDELIAKIAAMQWPDGYVNSYFTLKKATEPRWTDIEHKHELYCAGHLIEAAVAHFEMTGKLNFLDIGTKLAANIRNTFGDGQNANPCGHPEIEMALLRLVDHYASQIVAAPECVTGYMLEKSLHWSTANFFVAQHGRVTGRSRLWGEYALDDIPLVDRRQIAGHAVRAMYLLSAATDIQLRSKSEFRPALDAIWADLTQKKMYITGGIGNSAHNEGFTVAYDLPNDSAYAETCAAIGLVFWAHRMNLLHADAQYFDVLERALYNGVLSGISLDGEQFNYTNPLASRGKHRRLRWYACACCPPNLARLFPTIGGYQYARSDAGIYVNLYASGTAALSFAALDFEKGGVRELPVRITQSTRYPWDGQIKLTVAVDQPTQFALHLRVPGWCGKPRLSLGDQTVEAPEIEKGYIKIAGKWKGETEITLTLPMPVERVKADPRVKGNVGRVALQRGPIVYCLEGVDNEGRVRSALLPPDADVKVDRPIAELGGAMMLRAEGRQFTRFETSRASDETGSGKFTLMPAKPLLAIPYYAWNNRAAGEMIVWISESPEYVEKPPIPGVKASASHCWQGDTVDACYDGQEPANSNDHSIARFTWWPRKGSPEWVQYDFDRPREVSAVSVYWFDDGRRGGGCRAPVSWRLQYRDGEDWKDVSAAGSTDGASAPPGVALDRFNRVAFAPVTTGGLRIVAQLTDGFSGGILEWKIETR